MLGLRVELLVLLSAEMIAKRYYRALFEGTADPVLRATFSKILSDELGHVAFHTDDLRRAFSPLSPLARLSIWWVRGIFFATVCTVVAHDHRGVLQAVGVSRQAFRQDWRSHLLKRPRCTYTNPLCQVSLREDLCKRGCRGAPLPGGRGCPRKYFFPNVSHVKAIGSPYKLKAKSGNDIIR